ncbi:MAG: ribose 5-phosphate isomerase B [Chloroflexi bacterium]|nr:ribose 5-phosphate isomerase B [Chloroflexota bacterium]
MSEANEPGALSSPSAVKRPLITEQDVEAAPTGGELRFPAEAIVTPRARELALERKVFLSPQPGPVSTLSETPASGSKVIALGADHGGFAMKEALKAHLQELGYAVKDCGTFSSESVDYPDFAYAVARLVSEGQAWRGIMIDGAGIGSCMTANKVPGVRASMCYDLTTAVNAREHNDANVLTLGGRLIGENLAKEIVKTWLATEFAGGRHEGRVNKIMDVEKRYLRK